METLARQESKARKGSDGRGAIAPEATRTHLDSEKELPNGYRNSDSRLITAVTIDHEQTRVADDALSFQRHEQGWFLTLNTANLASQIDAGSAPGEPGAAAHSHTENVWPEYVRSQHNLMPPKPRPIVSFSCDIDPDHQIRDVYLELGQTKPEYMEHLTFQEVATIIREDNTEQAYWLSELDTLIGDVADRYRIPPLHTSNSIGTSIGRFNALCQQQAARLFQENSIPGIFRDLNRTGSEFRLTTRPLTATSRLPVTAPLRSYVDAINQHQLVAAFGRNGSELPYDNRDLEMIIATLNGSDTQRTIGQLSLSATRP